MNNFSNDTERETYINEAVNVIMNGEIHFFEEAELFSDVLLTGGITQLELAVKIGRTQGYIANKMRLLKFSQKMRRNIIEAGLSEKHARALLDVKKEKQQTGLIRLITEYKISAADTLGLVRGEGEVLAKLAEKKKKKQEEMQEAERVHREILEREATETENPPMVAEDTITLNSPGKAGESYIKKKQKAVARKRALEAKTQSPEERDFTVKEKIMDKINFAGEDQVRKTKFNLNAIRKFTQELRKNISFLEKMGVILSTRVDDTEDSLNFIICFPKKENHFWK